MNKTIRSAGALLLCSALFIPAAHAYLTVTGNGATTAATFVTTPTAAVFHKPTGDNYFGQIASADSNTFALSYANNRSTPDTAPTLTGLASDALLIDLNICPLEIVDFPSVPTLPTVVAASTIKNILRLITKSSTTVVSSAALNDASGAAVSSGVAGGNHSIAGGLSYVSTAAAGAAATTTQASAIFAAVLPNAGTNFGIANSGIAAGMITRNATTGAPIFTLYDARPAGGAVGNRAADCSVTVGLGTTPFCQGGTGASTNVDLWFDPNIGSTGRLYIGAQMRSLVSAAANTAYGVGIFIPTINTTAATFTLTNTGNLPAVALAATTKGIVTTNGNGLYSSILKVRTMHTSTGLSYLIVNGGNGQANAVGNQVYALPLVNGTDTAADGLFAKTTSFTNGQYTVAADGATADYITSDSIAAIVGNGKLPCAATDTISDMYVTDDAVYCAINATLAPTTLENGVYKSQAIFNILGQVVAWSEWQKVLPNDMGTTTDGTNGGVNFVAVDGYNGSTWATNSTSLWTRITQWTLPTGSATSQELLPSAVNTALVNTSNNTACYSVLDLNTSTTAWGATTAVRMTLFGGENKVCFALTGSAVTTAANNLSLAAANTSVNVSLLSNGAGNAFDYTNSATFIISPLPAGAGPVVSLGFSGWAPDAATTAATANTVGFFLAGTAGTSETSTGGLYAFVQDTTTKVGFNPAVFTGNAQLSNSTCGWVKIDNVLGMPVKICAMGGGLHVLTRTSSIDRIYSVSKQGTGVALNSSFVVTASTRAVPTAGSTNSSLSAVTKIFDFCISQTATAAGATAATAYEQLAMITNDGLYTTSSIGGLQGPASLGNANAQLNAGWFKVGELNAAFENNLNVPLYNRLNQMFWGTTATPNTTSGLTNVYNRSCIDQLVTNVNGSGTFVFAPTVPTGDLGNFQSDNETLFPDFAQQYTFIYSDGGSRYFITKKNDTDYSIVVLPFNAAAYNITTAPKAALTNSALAGVKAVYWMSNIGDTGRLMMGTNVGVISLQ